MKIISKIFITIIPMLLMLSPVTTRASEVTGLVRVTVDRVLEVLRDESLRGPERTVQRRGKIREVIQERFSFRQMSQRSLAQHWRSRTETEKREFVELFSDVIENAYIEKIEGYSGETVQYIGEDIRDGLAQVKTRILAKGTTIPVNYRLVKTPDRGWMVYDIVIERVSLVSTYRSQFNSIIRSSSYDELIRQLRDKRLNR